MPGGIENKTEQDSTSRRATEETDKYASRRKVSSHKRGARTEGGAKEKMPRG